MDFDQGFSESFDAALGRAVRLISHFDWRLSQVTLFLIQGKGWQSHMESWYYAGSFGKSVGVSGRINLLHDLMIEFLATQSGDYGRSPDSQIPDWFKDLERDLRQVNSRRNRIAHDAWWGDSTEGRPLLIPHEHPVRGGKWDSGDFVSEQDLRSFSDFVQRVIGELDALWERPDIVEWVGKNRLDNG